MADAVDPRRTDRVSTSRRIRGSVTASPVPSPSRAVRRRADMASSLARWPPVEQPEWHVRSCRILFGSVGSPQSLGHAGVSWSRHSGSAVRFGYYAD